MKGQVPFGAVVMKDGADITPEQVTKEIIERVEWLGVFRGDWCRLGNIWARCIVIRK
jgi:hypothetical protein